MVRTTTTTTNTDVNVYRILLATMASQKKKKDVCHPLNSFLNIIIINSFTHTHTENEKLNEHYL